MDSIDSDDLEEEIDYSASEITAHKLMSRYNQGGCGCVVVIAIAMVMKLRQCCRCTGEMRQRSQSVATTEA